MSPTYRQLPAGSKPFRFTLSDGIATIRDSVLVILAAFIAQVNESIHWLDMPQEVQAALVVVLYACFKAVWKFFSDTQRVSDL